MDQIRISSSEYKGDKYFKYFFFYIIEILNEIFLRDNSYPKK